MLLHRKQQPLTNSPLPIGGRSSRLFRELESSARPLNTMTKELELPLYQAEIRSLVPHRYPLLLVDRVTEYEEGSHASGLKNVSANEPFFEGHFPDQPIMPGVLILEALAQLGVIFSKLESDMGPDDKVLAVFAGIDEVRFRRQVVPGDTLLLRMGLEKRRKNIWRMKGTAHVGDDLAAQGILISSVIPIS